MLKKPRYRFRFLFLFTACELVALSIVPQLYAATLTKVKVVSVSVQDVKSTVTCTGEIEAGRSQSVTVSSPLLVKSLHAQVGDSVQAGEVIAEVDTAASAAALQTGKHTAAKSTDASTEQALEQAKQTLTEEQYNALLQTYGLQGDPQSGAADSQAVDADASGADTDAAQNGGTAAIPDTLCAPIDGMLTELYAQTGQFTEAAQTVMVVCDMSTLRVRAQISEASLASVKEGQSCSITGDGFSKAYTGRVAKIYPTAHDETVSTGTLTVVDVLIDIDAPDCSLRPGLSADVAITTGENKRSVCVPYTAVGQNDQNHEYVYVYKDGFVMQRYITTGIEFVNSVQVISGLSAGEQIVESPPDGMENGRVLAGGV